MSGKNDDETLSEAERLISEYKNTSSTREKIKKIQAFNDLWDCANSEYYMYTGMLQGMQHVGLLPLIIESLTSRECVTVRGTKTSGLLSPDLISLTDGESRASDPDAYRVADVFPLLHGGNPQPLAHTFQPV